MSDSGALPSLEISQTPGATLAVFHVGGDHETRRLVAALEAMGPSGWDPSEVLAGEAEAHRRLYSGLDADQQAAYNNLVAAGILPPQVGG